MYEPYDDGVVEILAAADLVAAATAEVEAAEVRRSRWRPKR